MRARLRFMMKGMVKQGTSVVEVINLPANYLERIIAVQISCLST